MSLRPTRIFAYFTLVSYLIVGTVAVRFCMPEQVSLTFTSSYLTLFTDAPLKQAKVSSIEMPEIKFAEIKIPVEKVIVKRAPLKVAHKTAVKPSEMIVKVSASNELPFHEPVKLTAITTTKALPADMTALYKDFSMVTDRVVAEAVGSFDDEVSTKQASVENVEPDFFEYPAQTAQTKPTETKTETGSVKKDNNVDEVASTETEVQNISDLVETPVSENVAEVTETEKEPEFFDYPEVVNTQTEKTEITKAAAPQTAPMPVSGSAATEVTADTDLIAFDYSKANAAVNSQTIPTTSALSTQQPKPSDPTPVTPEFTNTGSNLPKGVLPENQNDEESGTNAFMAPVVGHPVNLSIVAMGSDLKKIENLQGFEVRFQDDLSEILEDFGAGEIKFSANMSQPKMTRAVTVLKRGYTPTSTELILEEDTDVASSVSIPMIEDETFNELQKAHERKGPVGGLLVELDDESELAKIDVPFGTVIKLDGDFKKTDSDDFRYQLFVGVQAGNAMLSYHRNNGEVVTKILHVHENEVTYDANFYEDVVNEKVRLYEEDLLGKESSPLIISGEQVRVFAGNTTAKKVNNHTYKMDFNSSHLGGRRYLELGHQSEPLFVGIRENTNVTVPSENFMRFILSKFEGEKLSNRCLIQINLSKKAEAFQVASESVASSLSTTTQVLDNDGKFYDSLSEKTQKIMIVGESQGSEQNSADAKVNVRIQYLDGTTQYLNSYCSPNTYLVEQL